MAATIRRAEADFPAREKPKNRIRGLLIEGDPGTWPSFLRTIPNFPEFLQALRDLFRVFVAVHRNFSEFLLVRRAGSARSPNKSPELSGVFESIPI